MRHFRVFVFRCWVFAMGVLLASAGDAANVNGSGASLNLPTTDFSSGGTFVNGAGARLVSAGTPATGSVSVNGAGAKIILDPMNASAALDVPTVDFSTTPATGAAPLEVLFTSTSMAGLNDILSWAWDFGDGSPSASGQIVTHTYDNAGVYTVTLTITTEAGSLSKTKVGCVTVAQGVPAIGWPASVLACLLLVALTIRRSGVRRPISRA